MSDDRELVQRCLRGDSAAYRQFVERFEQDIHRLCFRMLRQQQDAEDVTQDVLLRIFKNLQRWDQSRPIRPWLFRIAVNRCRTQLSQRKRLMEPVEFLQELPDHRVPDGSNEVHEALQQAVDALRPEYREVFILYHETGHSYEEIAEIIRSPIGTIRTWLHRARSILEAQLQELGFLPKPELDLSPEKTIASADPS